MEYTEICVEIINETKAAYLVDDGGGIDVWIPKSQIQDQSVEENCSIMNIPEWLAIEKGLI